MKFVNFLFLFLLVTFSSHSLTSAQTLAPETIEEFNSVLPLWGVSWAPGKQAINGYYPTFYTGFALRSQFPERIHVRTARGNQTRVSVILDETSVRDYPFDLATRYRFYNRVTGGDRQVLNIQPSGSSFLPQLSYFNNIIENPTYGILSTVERATHSSISEAELYRTGLELVSILNPGRVFHLNIDLSQEFARWAQKMIRISQGSVDRITSNPQLTVIALNDLVQGRINLTSKPTEEQMSLLKMTLELAISNAPSHQLNPLAFQLFTSLTGSKYQFHVLDENGQWRPAAQCSSTSCSLKYSEFTTIYPTGSAEAFTKDEFGNRITSFATPGLWQFLNYSGREVDNIRNEPYYGFAPKMDYEGIGNGFHNPAVRFWGVSKATKETFGIDESHNTLWAVKRGGVSHGCLRIPLGHVWELRQILPVENSKMTQVKFFGHNSQDFDLYDIDGNGSLEVMGVQYMISYGLQGADGLARREGADLEINSDRKLQFYNTLYGAKNVFRVENDRFIFMNPKVSYPSYLDFKKKAVSTRHALTGDFPLYEQDYEKDKVQFYSLGSNMSAQNKLIVRLMGRVRGCAPTTDAQSCGSEAFNQEAERLLR